MKNFEIVNNGVNLELLKEDIIFPIEKAFNSLHIQNDHIDSLTLVIVFNQEITDFPKLIKENLFSIIEINSPKEMDGNQYNKIKNFVNETRRILSTPNQIKIEEAGVSSITLLMIYNYDLKSLHINGLNIKKTTPSSSDSFVPINPKYSFNQVVLNEKLQKEIKNSVAILKKRELIYHTWGFEDIEPSPKAILNFYGPSGTGKTMTAHAIADSLDIKIMALNYADIESKFVGDAPKNLIKAFEIATREKALLFFDEADSFLGKRITNISSSTDQAVNSLRSQMLILLENFEGIVIFATNLMDNYDKAFESRIFKHLEFKLPDMNARKLIISKSIPSKVPFEDEKRLDDIQIEELAQISDGLSGRHIKNAILSALTNAAISDKKYLTYDDFFSSFKNLKQSIDNINSDKSTLNPIQKKDLEKKIANKLKKERKKRKNKS